MSITLPQKQLSSGISPSANVDTSEIRRLGRAEQQRVAAIGDLGQAVTSGLMKYGEMTARNLSNQEIFQGELAYKKGMDDHDLMLATSQDMEVIKNADKLTEAESDRLQADIFSKPIYKRSRQELEQTFAAQKQSRVLKSKINSYDRVAQNFHAMVPTMTETYAADTVHGDMRFAEMMSENAPLISEAQAAAYTKQYQLQKGLYTSNVAMSNIRAVTQQLSEQGLFVEANKINKEEMDNIRVEVGKMDIDPVSRTKIINYVDAEESSLRSDLNTARIERGRKASMDLAALKTEGKLTSIWLDEREADGSISSSRANTERRLLKQTTTLSEGDKKRNLSTAIDTMLGFRSGEINEADAEKAIQDIPGLGAEGQNMIKEITGYEKSTTSSGVNHALTTAVATLKELRKMKVDAAEEQGLDEIGQMKVMLKYDSYITELYKEVEKNPNMSDVDMRKFIDSKVNPVKDDFVKEESQGTIMKWLTNLAIFTAGRETLDLEARIERDLGRAKLLYPGGQKTNPKTGEVKGWNGTEWITIQGSTN